MATVLKKGYIMASNREPGKGSYEFNLLTLDITDKEFKNFSDLIYELTGIHITDKKRQLVVGRLTKRLKHHGFKSFSQYYDYLHTPEATLEVREFINQITTNKTDFFRENHHFEFLSGIIIPQLIQQREKSLRFWSAGCSTGEEPYSLAITILETLEQLNAGSGWDIKILATDLDTNVMKKTMAGVYETRKIQTIAPQLQKKYFIPMGSEFMQIKPEVRRLLTVKRLNLMNPYPFKKGFNAIFCRNVLIYFTPEDRRKVVEKMHYHIRKNGHLFLGHSESLLADTIGFKNLGHTIYQKMG